MKNFHQPVMTEEIVKYLLTDYSGVYVDGTVGGGGHSKAILRQQNFSGKVIAIDRDEEAIAFSENELAGWKNQVAFYRGDFSNFDKFLEQEGHTKMQGLLLDLGVSYHQISTSGRGFSYSNDGPLDMRMDRTASPKAQYIVNQYPAEALERIFREYGEERYSRKIAHKIIEKRAEKKLNTTFELLACIDAATPPAHRRKTYARIFQAIRIAINNELDELRATLEKAINTLVPGGRICALAYHSLEDRILKETFLLGSQRCICPPSFPVCRCDHKKQLKIITKKPITPSETERTENSRSRSAKLRVAEKI